MKLQCRVKRSDSDERYRYRVYSFNEKLSAPPGKPHWDHRLAGDIRGFASKALAIEEIRQLFGTGAHDVTVIDGRGETVARFRQV